MGEICSALCGTDYTARVTSMVAVMCSHRREAFRTRLASVDSRYWRAGDEVPGGFAAASPVGIGAAGIKPGAAPEDETAAGPLPASAGAGIIGEPCPCGEFGLKPVDGMGDATTFMPGTLLKSNGDVAGIKPELCPSMGVETTFIPTIRSATFINKKSVTSNGGVARPRSNTRSGMTATTNSIPSVNMA